MYNGRWYCGCSDFVATITAEASKDRCSLSSENQTGVCDPIVRNRSSATTVTVAEATDEVVNRTRLGDVVAVTPDVCRKQSSRLLIEDQRTASGPCIERLVVNLEANEIPRRIPPDVR